MFRRTLLSRSGFRSRDPHTRIRSLRALSDISALGLIMGKPISAKAPPSNTLQPFYCHSCGRHTSSHRSKASASELATPPKYCSKRCRSQGKPELDIVQAWKGMLDVNKADLDGVKCDDVQELVYDERTGERRSEYPPSTEGSEEAQMDPQQLGMKNAYNRENVRRAARLLCHYSWQHFAPKAIEGAAGPNQAGVWNETRNVEPVQHGKVLKDVTHAKGGWGLRWVKD